MTTPDRYALRAAAKQFGFALGPDDAVGPLQLNHDERMAYDALASEWPRRQPIERCGRTELKEFIRAYLARELIIMQDLPENDVNTIRAVFMPIGFGALSNVDPLSIGTIYEYLSKAGPTGVNGYPCFFSLRLLSTADWIEAREYIVAELKRREEAQKALDDTLGD